MTTEIKETPEEFANSIRTFINLYPNNKEMIYLLSIRQMAMLLRGLGYSEGINLFEPYHANGKEFVRIYWETHSARKTAKDVLVELANNYDNSRTYTTADSDDDLTKAIIFGKTVRIAE